MKFLVDNQLPAALARRLTELGFDTVHVGDLGLDRSSDSEILNHASLTDRVLISKDQDFVSRTSRPGRPVPLIWTRLGNCRKTVLLDAMERLWPAIIEALERGERLIEIQSPLSR